MSSRPRADRRRWAAAVSQAAASRWGCSWRAPPSPSPGRSGRPWSGGPARTTWRPRSCPPTSAAPSPCWPTGPSRRRHPHAPRRQGAAPGRSDGARDRNQLRPQLRRRRGHFRCHGRRYRPGWAAPPFSWSGAAPAPTARPHCAAPRSTRWACARPGSATTTPVCARRSWPLSPPARPGCGPRGSTRADYTATAMAQDVEDLRVAAGVDRWEMAGSYGTQSAVLFEYLARHPGRSRLPTSTHRLHQPRRLPRRRRRLQDTLDALFQRASRRPTCAADHPDLGVLWSQALDRATTTPLRGTADSRRPADHRARRRPQTRSRGQVRPWRRGRRS